MRSGLAGFAAFAIVMISIRCCPSMVKANFNLAATAVETLHPGCVSNAFRLGWICSFCNRDDLDKMLNSGKLRLVIKRADFFPNPDRGHVLLPEDARLRELVMELCLLSEGAGTIRPTLADEFRRHVSLAYGGPPSDPI
eukprot:gnl/TRDRNA2_/TRDRNA2_88735_c0_seq1.p1 gnl/TRDRNA2_/TRDRNA2_88735_c0~~gnl/TRDRNA2_/TRDRNA2_88735_c0_seq1.p1  ORF type:complete len:139 (-),score=12.52 gnl/TRDRNA2_/TRDRNA2_88735_c0_seq1:116-532(-)